MSSTEYDFDIWKTAIYVADKKNTPEDIAKFILSHKTRSPSQGVECLKITRTEFGIKLVDAINLVHKMADMFVIDQLWRAKQDWKNFSHGQVVKVTKPTEIGVLFDGIYEVSREDVLRYFEKHEPIKRKK